MDFMKEEVVELARELLLDNEYLFEIALEMAQEELYGNDSV
jgi:hypothetical protein